MFGPNTEFIMSLMQCWKL